MCECIIRPPCPTIMLHTPTCAKSLDLASSWPLVNTTAQQPTAQQMQYTSRGSSSVEGWARTMLPTFCIQLMQAREQYWQQQ